MECPGDQLFSGACLSINEDGGISGCDRLNVFENAAQRHALSDNILEVKFAADFGFEIDVFLRELILEFGNLPIGESVFNRESDLTGDLPQERKIIFSEGVLPRTRNTQDAQHASPTQKRQAGKRVVSLRRDD